MVAILSPTGNHHSRTWLVQASLVERSIHHSLDHEPRSSS